MKRLIEQEEIALARLSAYRTTYGIEQITLIITVEQLACLQTLQFVGQLRGIGELGHLELAGGMINEREAEALPFAIHGGEVVRAGAIKHGEIADGPSADDLRNLTLHQLAGHGLGGLLGDGDSFSCGDEFGNVALSRVMRHATHGNAIALGKGNVQDR